MTILHAKTLTMDPSTEEKIRDYTERYDLGNDDIFSKVWISMWGDEEDLSESEKEYDEYSYDSEEYTDDDEDEEEEEVGDEDEDEDGENEGEGHVYTRATEDDEEFENEETGGKRQEGIRKFRFVAEDISTPDETSCKRRQLG